jgi:hypothetical protein
MKNNVAITVNRYSFQEVAEKLQASRPSIKLKDFTKEIKDGKEYIIIVRSNEIELSRKKFSELVDEDPTFKTFDFMTSAIFISKAKEETDRKSYSSFWKVKNAFF